MMKSQEKIRVLRDTFLENPDTVFDSKNERESLLLSEWRDSRLRGIDHAMRSLDDSCQDPQMADRISTIAKAYWDQLKSYYGNKHRILDTFGAAILYADKDCSIFNKAGNRELLDHLKTSLNIHFGTNLGTHFIGAGVISAANKEPFTTVTRVGAENYLDIFQDYVLYARTTPKMKYDISPCTVIILPLDQYSASTGALMSYILEAEDIIIENDLMLPYVMQREKLMELAMATDEDGILVLGLEGTIEYTNKTFTSEFDSSSKRIKRHRSLEHAMPELQFTLDCLKTGKGFLPREVRLKNSRNRESLYYLQAQVLKTETKVYGLKLIVKKSTEIRKYLSGSNNREARFTFENLIGENARFRELKSLAESAAKTSTSILISGESGTGKELFAQSIHNASKRSANRFIALNCAAIPKELIGSELFGYDEGAFTGARKGGQIGKFEQADRGTIFLDEISEMPLDMQAVLLRFLEDGIVTRLGGTKPIPLDVRIVAASNRNLQEYVNEGKFRLDLFFRINVIDLELPPLRARIDDMDALVEHFLQQLSRQMDKRKPRMSPQVMELFRRYSWPGNLRELRNMIERIIVLGDDELIMSDTLPQDVYEALAGDKERLVASTAFASASPTRSDEAFANRDGIDTRIDRDIDVWTVKGYKDYENKMIKALMMKYRGNKSRVAQELKISRATLYRRLREIEEQSR